MPIRRALAAAEIRPGSCTRNSTQYTVRSTQYKYTVLSTQCAENGATKHGLARAETAFAGRRQGTH